jgi:hypothetical protein
MKEKAALGVSFITLVGASLHFPIEPVKFELGEGSLEDASK